MPVIRIREWIMDNQMEMVGKLLFSLLKRTAFLYFCTLSYQRA